MTNRRVGNRSRKRQIAKSRNCCKSSNQDLLRTFCAARLDSFLHNQLDETASASQSCQLPYRPQSVPAARNLTRLFLQMAKLKAPTPQDLYRARKLREEQEKIALLPPGLYNHGNTCFMNSVLQGVRPLSRGENYS